MCGYVRYATRPSARSIIAPRHVGVQVEARDDRHLRPDDAAHARENLAFAVVEMLGHHRAVQVEVDAVDGRPPARGARVISPTMRSNASLVTCAEGDAAPHASPGVRWPARVQRVERAGGRNVGAVEARRDRVAERQRRPAAALLERVIVRLRRREGVGLVLESADGNHAMTPSRCALRGSLRLTRAD